MKLDNYIINYNTLLIRPIDEWHVKVYEFDGEFIVNKNIKQLIKESCLYFGSSIDGRKQGTKDIINCEIKLPLIIEDSRNLIIFPTASYRKNDTIWIVYNNLLNYSMDKKSFTHLNFINNFEIDIPVRYNIVDNQMIRCIKLYNYIRRRKEVLLQEKVS